ncbi:hypothetical protein AB0K00_27055 [Dactylosporangium sp. NPDC049525]|uniref:tautomerase family protein n=1 Tax=Dactylosporangium sp. NPDC049525 TaxID=3154730 RepID=UPI003416AA05
MNAAAAISPSMVWRQEIVSGRRTGSPMLHGRTPSPPRSDIEELPMPHVTLYALEEELTGREPGLIGELTDAVVSVYGEWARRSVDVRLIGIPAGRWARGGATVTTAAPSITFGMREEVFARDDAASIVAQLVAAFTDAVTAVFGAECRDDVLVELVGQPTSRSGLGGKVISAGD